MSLHGQMCASSALVLLLSHCGSSLKDIVEAPVAGEYMKIGAVGYCAAAAS